MIALPNMRKYRHVLEGDKKKEGREGPPLLERGGKCSCWQTCISAVSAVSWRIEPGIVLDTRLWVTRAGGLLAPISPSYQQAGSNMKRRRDQFLNFLLLLFLTRAIKMEIRHGVVIPFDLWTRPLCQPLASGHCSRLGSSTASSGCVHYSLICTSASSCQQTDWQ